MSALARPKPTVKPRLRGVSHEITFYLGLIGAALLLRATPAGAATTAVAIYAASFLFLFGASAFYHRPTWSPAARAVVKRIDHSAIYLLIAGTYTPIALLAVPPEVGQRLLWMVWTGAALGVAQSIAWPKAPKPLVALLYVALGWVVVMEWSAVAAGVGPVGIGLIVGGGVTYTVGAVVYAAQWPNPAPKTFGYHEIFHALVITAALAHATMVAGLAGLWPLR